MDKEALLKSMEQALEKCAARYEEERHDAYGSVIYSRKKEHMEHLLTVVRAAEDLDALRESWAAEIESLTAEIDLEEMHPTFCEGSEYYYAAALSGRRAAIRDLLAILQNA